MTLLGADGASPDVPTPTQGSPGGRGGSTPRPPSKVAESHLASAGRREELFDCENP